MSDETSESQPRKTVKVASGKDNPMLTYLLSSFDEEEEKRKQHAHEWWEHFSKWGDQQ